MIIDSHGHYTTVPAGMQTFRATQITNLGVPAKHPVNISDDQIQSTLENGQLKLQNERGTDLAIFSPRASAMGHHFGTKMISRYWTEVNNEIIDRVCKLYP
ncbi:MAG: amidohydrolase, partial [Chloroflexi bacterium]|nr:amidohydrolase [Chloroflexota bacterium]